MSGATYIRGLVSSESHQETSVTDEELCRVSDLLDGGEKPLTGFEIHLLKALRSESQPITPKEMAIVQAMKTRRGEFHRDVGHDNFPSYTDPSEQAENNAILKEMWGDVDDSFRSDEAGWLYED